MGEGGFLDGAVESGAEALEGVGGSGEGFEFDGGVAEFAQSELVFVEDFIGGVVWAGLKPRAG